MMVIRRRAIRWRRKFELDDRGSPSRAELWATPTPIWAAAVRRLQEAPQTPAPSPWRPVSVSPLYSMNGAIAPPSFALSASSCKLGISLASNAG